MGNGIIPFHGGLMRRFIFMGINFFILCGFLYSQQDTTRYFLIGNNNKIDWNEERLESQLTRKPYYSVSYSSKNEIVDIQFNKGKKNRFHSQFKLPKWIPFFGKPKEDGLVTQPSDTVFVDREVVVTIHDTIRIHDTTPQAIKFVVRDPENLKNILYSKGYFGKWDPYKVRLEERNTVEWFNHKSYYEAQLNKDGRIKKVSYFDENHILQYVWNYKWSKKGTRYEYYITFFKNNRLSDIDSILFSDILSDVRSNWVARFKTRRDGRPENVSIYDENGIMYYRYKISYKIMDKKDGYFEKIRSSYFRSDNTLAGSHLIYNNKDQFPYEIYYFNKNGEYKKAIFIDYWPRLNELQKTVHDSSGAIESRRIMAWNPVL